MVDQLNQLVGDFRSRFSVQRWSNEIDSNSVQINTSATAVYWSWSQHDNDSQAT